MLTISELRENLDGGDWIVVRPTGEMINVGIPENFGPATLVVSAVTDALKTHDGRLITGSLNRDDVWAVDAFALNRVILNRLEGTLTPFELYQAVVDMGIAWQVDQAPVQ